MKNLFISLIIILFIGNIQAQQAITTQQSTTQGLGIHLEPGLFIFSSNDLESEGESGFALGGGVSYGFSELIEAFVNIHAMPSVQNKTQGGINYSFSHVDLGVRFNFSGTSNPLRPHLDVAYSTGNMNLPEDSYDNAGNYIQTLDYKIKGGGFSFGGGIKYHLSIPLSLMAGIRFTAGSFDNLELVGSGEEEVDWDFFNTRIYVGGIYRIIW